MKNLNFYALLLFLSLNVIFASCDKKTPTPEPEPDITEGMHFDIWTPIGGNAGSGTVDCIVKRTTSLEKVEEFNFLGSGVDLSQKIYPTVIVKGKYYYIVTKDGRFGKYQITPTNLVTVKEIPFSALKDRRHTHAWINEHQLLLIGSNGPSDKIVWAKVDTETMTVTAEGELNLPAPPAGQVFNTSGIAAYRKSDNKMIYFFTYNKSTTEPKPQFYASFINPTDMSVITTITETRAEQMAATAYGELRQDKSFFDENGDYYLACNSVLPGEGTTTAQRGALLRIKKDAMDFDKSFNGYTRERGKIVTASYLNNGKALLLMQDPKYVKPNEAPVWNSTTNPYVFYWIIVDLKTNAITDLQEKGVPIGNGNFSQLAQVVGKKAYFAVNPKEDKSRIYIYDTTTEVITKGTTLAEGYTVDRIVWIED